jgi:hypothetical protein
VDVVAKILAQFYERVVGPLPEVVRPPSAPAGGLYVDTAGMSSQFMGGNGGGYGGGNGAGGNSYGGYQPSPAPLTAAVDYAMAPASPGSPPTPASPGGVGHATAVGIAIANAADSPLAAAGAAGGGMYGEGGGGGGGGGPAGGEDAPYERRGCTRCESS